MQTAILYLVTAVVFFAMDFAGIRYLVRPVFERHVGHLLAEPMRLASAGIFYLFYVAGVLWFVSLPALREGAPLQALTNGAVLGLLAYGTYELTNYATLEAWSFEQVLVDGLWGTFLTGVAAWIGVAVVLRQAT
jgi:uncharacterized membrane protein